MTTKENELIKEENVKLKAENKILKADQRMLAEKKQEMTEILIKNSTNAKAIELLTSQCTD